MFESVFTFVHRPSAILYDYLFWWQIAAFVALPLALLFGLLRTRLARASIGDLVLELERTPPQSIVPPWRGHSGTGQWRFSTGSRNEAATSIRRARPAELPKYADRAVTRLKHEGEPLAALVHDPSLLDEPRLLEAAGAAARLALENARLQAETRAQLEEVRGSRVRIVNGGRRGTAAHRARHPRRRTAAPCRAGTPASECATPLPEESDPEVDRLLAVAVSELQVAVEELRELARGVHPAILTEDGLAAALDSLVSRSPFPIELDADEGRLPAPVEATAYFVACEALANVVKHAGASNAKVTAHQHDGMLVVEVSDDGIGGARANNGSGLSGLADRSRHSAASFASKARPCGHASRREIPCAS